MRRRAEAPIAHLPEKALSYRVILLSGTEESPRRQALSELREKIGGDPFDQQVFVAGDGSASEWLAAASTVPFLSETRTAIVRNLLRVGPPSEVFANPKESLSSVPEFGRLILVADDELASDHTRQQKLDSIRKAWDNEVEKSGGLAILFKMDPAAAKGELLKQAEAMGKKLSPAAADLLLEMTGRSLSRAMDELEKLISYVGDAPAIREADIEATVIASREWNVFKLADSIIEGNAGQALSQLRDLVGSGTKSENAAMQSIFPNLTKNLRLVWQARAFVEAKASVAKPPPEVLAMLPEQGSLASAPDWQKNRAMSAARRLSYPALAECMEIVARTDARFKGLLPGFSSADTLERMVMEMVETVRARN